MSDNRTGLTRAAYRGHDFDVAEKSNVQVPQRLTSSGRCGGVAAGSGSGGLAFFEKRPPIVVGSRRCQMGRCKRSCDRRPRSPRLITLLE